MILSSNACRTLLRAGMLVALWLTIPALHATTWYVRSDGAGRYDANRVSWGYTGAALGCDGQGDAPYPGSGTNQHCAFNDYRFLWDDQTSAGLTTWVIAGGDTVIIRGCAANAQQVNPSNPNCRVGWDEPQYLSQPNFWCFGGSAPGCHNPQIPAGTSGQHTRILGQNFAACSTGNQPNESAMTELFGGFSASWVLDLQGAQYVDVQCLHITSHNGTCVIHGSPAYPAGCNTGPPYSDYDGNGIETNNTTAHVLLQDVWIDGHTASGIQGPIGGALTLNRVFIGFNGFAGYNFDDGSATPDGAGSSITANYVTMEGNGCNEEYPVVHTFPAQACYDLNSGGFGDSWSGQQTELDAFTCNHCQMLYNTKDGFLGPHSTIKTLLIENSQSVGNMGQQWKWVNTPNSTTAFINNLTVGNCNRLSVQLLDAPVTFNEHLSLFCRAAGDVFSFSSNANSTVLLANNTVVAYSNTIFDMDCVVLNGCGTTPYVYTNNLILGYTVASDYFEGANGQAPGLFFFSDATDSIVSTFNLEYGIRNGDTCGGNILCGDPLLTGEPSQSSNPPPESNMDGFLASARGFYPTGASPVLHAGTTYTGLPAADYYGVTTTSPPVIGGVNFFSFPKSALSGIPHLYGGMTIQ